MVGNIRQLRPLRRRQRLQEQRKVHEGIEGVVKLLALGPLDTMLLEARARKRTVKGRMRHPEADQEEADPERHRAERRPS